jgi:MSHA pilin protein MshC
MRNRLTLKSSAGFSLIELVVIILLLGILSFFAVPKFINLDSYRERTSINEVAGAIRYAQKLAVASGCEVRFSASGSDYTLQQCSSSCTDGLTPATRCASANFADLTNYPVTGGSVTGISFSSTPANFTFNALGRIDTAAAIAATIAIGGENINVYSETGYVEE